MTGSRRCGSSHRGTSLPESSFQGLAGNALPVTTAHPQDFVVSRRLSPEQRGLAWMGGVLVALIAVLVLALALFDWNLLRGPLARLASQATGRNVRIDGDLKVHLLTADPRVSVGGLKISQPAWAGKGDMATVDTLTAETHWMSLLRGRPVLPLLELVHPSLDLRRDTEGRTNWSFSQHPSKGAALKLPPIERFVIDSGRLHVVDAERKLVIDGTIDSNERASGPQSHAFSLVGRGTLNHSPFDLTVTGGALINVKLDQPYPFSGALRMGATHIEATGKLHRPFDLSAFSTRLHLSGPDLADLYYLTQLALPNTPSYDLRGELKHSGKDYDLNGISGRIGASDIAGQMDVSTASGRPFVQAAIHSRSLDFKDLAALVGAAPAGKTTAKAGPIPKASAASAGQARLLPDAPLEVDRLRNMDARLDYTAETVKDTLLPLRGAKLHLTLDHGLLTMDPLEFDLPQGRFTSVIALDGRGATPVTSIDARLSNVALQNFVPGSKGVGSESGGSKSGGAVDASAPIQGLLAARIKLTGRGDSVHRAAADSNGAVTVVIPHGQIRQAFAELLGVNAGKGLGLLLSKNDHRTDIRCGVAAFNVANGQLTASQIVLDTDVVRVQGQGGANLGSETLNLVLKGDSKRFRLTHVFLPITIGGHFRDPALGVQAAPAVAQVGAAVALGVALTPLAAILPFVDPGLAKNADCQALMADARTAPAPVKGALRTTPAKK